MKRYCKIFIALLTLVGILYFLFSGLSLQSNEEEDIKYLVRYEEEILSIESKDLTDEKALMLTRVLKDQVKEYKCKSNEIKTTQSLLFNLIESYESYYYSLSIKDFEGAEKDYKKVIESRYDYEDNIEKLKELFYYRRPLYAVR